MNIKRDRGYLFIGIFLLITTSVVGLSLKNYSDLLQKEGERELYKIKNRKVAIGKIRFAQTIWPFLRLDKPFQNLLGQLKAIEQRHAINIFIKENISTEDINALVLELQALNGVKQVKFISQNEAFKMYKETYKDTPLLLEMATPNILPPSIEVYLNDFTIRVQIEKIARSKPYVTEVVQLL